MKPEPLILEHLNYCAEHRAQCYGENFEVSKEKLRRKILKSRISVLLEGVGYVILREDYDNPDYLHISSILVEQSKQGKGHGSQLLEQAERETFRQGYKGITLTVRPDAGEKVHKFYLKNGYEKVKEEKGRAHYLKKF